jgi:hypothetical protein
MNAPFSHLICLLVLASSLLASCAQVPLASEQQKNAASAFHPRGGKAGIYIFRETGFVGSAIAYFVYVDGRLVGLCGNGTFLYTELEPGHHILSTDLTQFLDTSIDISPDQTYFVRLKAYLALGVGSRPPLRLVSQEEGRRGVANCKQAAAKF